MKTNVSNHPILARSLGAVCLGFMTVQKNSFLVLPGHLNHIAPFVDGDDLEARQDGFSQIFCYIVEGKESGDNSPEQSYCDYHAVSLRSLGQGKLPQGFLL